MGVKKRGNIFHYEFVIQGERHRGTTGCHGKRDAEARERRIRSEIEGKRARVTPTPTLFSAYRQDRARAKARGNTSAYIDSGLGSYWRNLLSHFGDQTPLAAITIEAINGYITLRRTDVRSQTISRELTVLKRAFMIVGTTPPTPWPKLKKDAPDKMLSGKLRDPADIARFLAELQPDARDQAIFAYYTGLRAAELRRVRLSWVRDGVLFLPAEATKSNRAREVGVATEALEALQRAAAHSDQPWEHRDFSSSYKKASARLGLYPHITLRDLRATFASLALARTSDATAVMRAMGHSNMATAVRYQHADLERLRAVGNSLPTVGPHKKS